MYFGKKETPKHTKKNTKQTKQLQENKVNFRTVKNRKCSRLLAVLAGHRDDCCCPGHAATAGAPLPPRVALWAISHSGSQGQGCEPRQEGPLEEALQFSTRCDCVADGSSARPGTDGAPRGHPTPQALHRQESEDVPQSGHAWTWGQLSLELSQLQRAGPGWRGQNPTPGHSAKATGDVFAGWPSRASPTRPGALPVSV